MEVVPTTFFKTELLNSWVWLYVPLPFFRVLVGNGKEVICSSFCPSVPIVLKKYKFMIDFYLLPLEGADAVLGVQWLKMLGPVVTDYEKLSMKFVWEGKLIHLEGENDNLASTISPKQL